MKTYKKLVAGVMALCMFSFAMVGCSKDSTTDETVGESSSTSDTANADADTTQAPTDENGSDTTTTTAITYNTEPNNLDYSDEITEGTVLTVAGYDIDVEEYRYYFLNLKKSFDNGDDSYWDGKATEGTDESGNDNTKTAQQNAEERLKDLKDYALTYIINNYCVEQMAKDYNVSLTDEELAEVDKDYEDVKASYESNTSKPYSTFEDYLTSTYCTKELYMKSLQRQKLEEKVVKSLYEEDFRKNLLPQYYHCKHILFSTMGLQYETSVAGDDATDEEKSKIEESNTASKEKAEAEVQAKAEDVLKQIKEGTISFDDALKEYNEDTGEAVDSDGKVDGYYFKKGTMVDEFENAFFALDEGQMSDLVKTNYGYHIIERLPLDDDYVNEHLLSLIMYDMNTGESTEYYEEYVALADTYYENTKIDFSDLYANINTKSLPEKSSVYAYIETTTTEAQ